MNAIVATDGRCRGPRSCRWAHLLRDALLATLLCAPWVAAQPYPQVAPPAPAASAQGGLQGVAEVGYESAPRWPMSIDTADGQLVVYQPQLTKFDGDKLSARAAVALTSPGQPGPTFGAVWIESRVATDRAARTVQVLDTTVTRAQFPDGGGPTPDALTAALRSSQAQQPMVLSLDQVLSMLQLIQQEKQSAAELSNDPPKIIFQTHPSVLVQYDGAPKLVQQAPPSNLLRAVNTPFFVALDPPTRTYYLKGGGRWFAAPDPLGPFRYAGAQVPPDVAALADGSGYQDPQQPLTDAQAAALEVVTATEPTELIWTDGAEEMATIPNTNLLYVANTSSDVFLLIDTQQIFVLLAGRWYTAPNRNGPWAYVPPDQLPPDFKLIPPGSEKADVLAHVAGTQAAKDAVADTFVPQTAAIDRRNFDQPTVQYDGEPNFQPVAESSPVQYAVNTPNSVLLVGNQYYCCSNAAWYVAAAPVGPWDVCTSVPAEIYTIPPSCPIYAVRYVSVYDATPDVVFVGYLPGYVGCYRYRGVVVYGTGYRYRPWVGNAYYARPYTFGFAPHYDSYRGHWGFDAGFGAGGGVAWFGDRAGPVVRRGGWFGHGGYRPVYVRGDVRIDPRRPDVDVRRPETRADEFNLYERRRDVHRPGPVGPGEQRRPEPGQADRGQGGDRGGVDRSRDNVLVDPQGDVYRKTIDGWEQRDHNQWTPRPEPGRAPEPARPEPPRDQAPREPAAAAAQPPRGEAPRPQAPREEPPRQAEPPREAPPNDATRVQPRRGDAPQRPAPAAPAENRGGGDLNREYHARVAGEQRARTAPTPPPVRAPAQPESPRQAPGGGNQPRGGSTGQPRAGPGSPRR